MKKITLCLLVCSLFAAQNAISRSASDDIITSDHVHNDKNVRAMALAYEIMINPSNLAKKRGSFAVTTLSAARQKTSNSEVKKGIQAACTALQKALVLNNN